MNESLFFWIAFSLSIMLTYVFIVYFLSELYNVIIYNSIYYRMKTLVVDKNGQDIKVNILGNFFSIYVDSDKAEEINVGDLIIAKKKMFKNSEVKVIRKIQENEKIFKINHKIRENNRFYVNLEDKDGFEYKKEVSREYFDKTEENTFVIAEYSMV